MRTILILGAGVMQLPAIRAARRRGLSVIVADGNPNAVGIPEADEFLPVDLKDHVAMAEAAETVRQRRGLDAVFTAGTDFSATVAYVAERLGLPGTSYESALNATDKFRMRRVLREAGVTVPDFTVLDAATLESEGCRAAQNQVALPVVVKPVDSMGARGVVRADSWNEADRYAREAVRYSRSSRVVIEGYIDGPEFSLDAVVYGDDIQITGFADRHIRFPPYFIEVGHTIPTALPGSKQALVIAQFLRAIRALGIGPGAAKGDVKLSSEGAVIGEVAARLSGGYMSGWTYPLSSGVPLSEIGVRVALGEPPPRARNRWNRTSAERAVVSIPGVLLRMEGVEAARSQPGVEELFVTRRPGDHLSFPRNNVEKAANIIAVADSRDDAVDAAEGAVARILPVLEPGHEETARFLFAEPDHREQLPPEYRHRAFSITPEPSADLRALYRRQLQAVVGESASLTLPTALRESSARDWSYRSIADSISELERMGLCRVRWSSSPSETVNDESRLFTRALLKGGLQGARYLLESLHRH